MTSIYNRNLAWRRNPNGPKINTIDIETLPLGVSAWSIWGTQVGISQVSKDWSIMSFASKELGKKEVTYADTRDSHSVFDDKELVAHLCSILDESDIVVGHNVRRFDLKKVRARALTHKIKPFREPLIIDTQRLAKDIAAFTSNKLEWLAGRLTDAAKDKHNAYPGFEMWAAVLSGDTKVWPHIEKYNKQDVVANEELLFELLPWAPKLPSLAMFFDDPEGRCPRCGGNHVHKHGHYHTNVQVFQQWLCSDCGGYSRSRAALHSPNERLQNLLTVTR